MFYKPTYCCSCGDKIERVDWKLFSSRKFCDLCETEYKFDEWLPRIVGALALVFGLWGIGNFFSSGAEAIEITNDSVTSKTNVRNLREDDRRFESRSLKSGRIGETQESSLGKIDSKRTEKKEKSSQPGDIELISKPPEKEVERKQVKREVSKPNYFCGAETKKGTPCSRKVKGKKRCWQHEGRKAMLPQKELAVGGNR